MSEKAVMLYLFAKKPGEGAVAALHEGYKRKESGRTGLPMLEKKSGLLGSY